MLTEGRTNGRTDERTNGRKPGSLYRAMPEAGATITLSSFLRLQEDIRFALVEKRSLKPEDWGFRMLASIYHSGKVKASKIVWSSCLHFQGDKRNRPEAADGS